MQLHILVSAAAICVRRRRGRKRNMEEAGKRGTRVELPLSRWENKGVWSDGGQPSGQSKTVQRHCAVLWQNTENRSSHSKKCTPAYFRVPKHLNACLDFQVHVEYILQCLQTSEKEGVEVSRNRRCRDKVWKERYRSGWGIPHGGQGSIPPERQ